MKQNNQILKIVIILVFMVLYSCNNHAGKEEKIIETKDDMPKVAILGMLHFVSENNAVSQKFTEVKSKKRQGEIEELVQLLKAYKPTIIAIERPYRSESELNKNYIDYLNGHYELTDEETDQIAFRLANELKHKRLFLAYAPIRYAFDSTVVFAQQHGQSKLIDSITNNAQELADEYDNIPEDGTIIDAIYYLNTDRAIDKNHLGYILLSQIGDTQHKIGADAVGDWYTSNINIFENIRQLVDSNSERILVIYGQGHSKILNQLINDSPELELVMINEFLM